MSAAQVGALLSTISFAHTFSPAGSRFTTCSLVSCLTVPDYASMSRTISDINMEDRDPVANNQYFPDFDGLHADSAFNEHLMTELAMSSFEQTPEWHNGMLTPSSTDLLLPLDRSSVPEQHTLESDMLSTPVMSQTNDSTWMHYNASIPAFDNGGEVHEPVSATIPQVI